MIIKLKRHCEHLAELTPEEAASLGPVLQSTCAALTKVLQPDPWLLAENARDDAAPALRGYDRSPEAAPSPHLWRGTLPTDLAAGEHAVEVRFFDPWRGEQRTRTRYRLEQASP